MWTMAPRLYAASGPRIETGIAVPRPLRPSPLHYIVRVKDSAGDPAAVTEFLAGRRFEFIDFDVV